jgi:hypothetical protein
MVVLTMRADFYSRCAAYPALSALIASQQFLISPMDLDGLRQAIEEPLGGWDWNLRKVSSRPFWTMSQMSREHYHC